MLSITGLRSRALVLFVLLFDFSTATLFLPAIQSISGFTDACTAAYSAGISACPDASSFTDQSSSTSQTALCTRDCFFAIYQAVQNIDSACQFQTASGSTIIGHAFIGDLGKFLCSGQASSDGSTASNAANTATSTNIASSTGSASPATTNSATATSSVASSLSVTTLSFSSAASTQTSVSASKSSASSGSSSSSVSSKSTLSTASKTTATPSHSSSSTSSKTASANTASKTATATQDSTPFDQTAGASSSAPKFSSTILSGNIVIFGVLVLAIFNMQ